MDAKRLDAGSARAFGFSGPRVSSDTKFGPEQVRRRILFRRGGPIVFSPDPHSFHRGLAFVIAVGLLFASMVAISAPANAVAPNEDVEPTPTPVQGEVPESARWDTLGGDWKTSEDMAWTATGDETGFHILRAAGAEGYQWTSVATLVVDGFETDRWIGNACATADSRWLAVVFAPRTFINDDDLYAHGAFGAFVDLTTGEVRSVGSGYTLASFNPGCGLTQEAVFTQIDVEGRSRLVVANPETTDSASAVELDSIVTSGVPAAGGVIAVGRGGIVQINLDGSERVLAAAEGIPFSLTIGQGSSISYLEHDGTDSNAKYLSSATEADQKPQIIAHGELSELGLARDTVGGVYITGAPDKVGTLPKSVRQLKGVATRVTMSSEGGLALSNASTDSSVMKSTDVRAPISMEAVVTETKASLEFTVTPDSVAESVDFNTAEPTAARAGFGTARSMGLSPLNANDPVSTGSPCAVPRNNPAYQAMQPRPAQVEWAADLAVKGELASVQGASDFPLPALAGGGRVPAQILLGILSQESNFWQASRYSVPGVPGNPLIGNYYGTNRSSSSPSAWWTINYANADCGYGIAQVTDGMESGDMSFSKQVAIATDYEANIARGLQILVGKWNEVHNAGMTIHDGDPAKLENWFYALWAYNTGFHPYIGQLSPWGVGWTNNPVNSCIPG